ncbi:MAG TPA: Ppx/GppA phosphatase family protein [Pyrinomonadaceae bacterium]|nr:Ppx/GppA phosphatase family protein [Pyrinomonadaceae bacterium]
MKFAAIDIGSNSIKLVVVDAAAGDSFAVLARKREIVRLGHETLLRGHISRDAIQRAAKCIKRLRSVANARGAESIVAIATASVREANNSARFVRAMEKKTGVRVSVLSGTEEARLIGLAASQGCATKGLTTLNIDIGGGSTEISVFRKGKPITLLSMKLGAVGLTERFLTSDPPTVDQLDQLRSEIRKALQGSARELREHNWEAATGTSGTVLAVGNALRLQSAGGNGNGDHDGQPAESIISLKDLKRFNAMLAVMNISQRRSFAGLTKRRAEIIVAGAKVLEETMRALAIDSLRTCNWSLREGVIIDRLRQWKSA